MRERRHHSAGYRRRYFLLAVGLGLLLAIFLFQIGSLLPGASENEVRSINEASKLRNITDNPLFAPHKLLQYILQKVGLKQIVALRAVSAVFAALFVTSFYLLTRRWHSRRISLLATCLVASSSWLLTIGRSATPTIMFTSWFSVIFLIFWFRHSRSVKLAPLIFFSLLLIFLYVPGTVYLVGLLALWYAPKAKEFFRFMRGSHIVLGVLAGIVMLLPLGYGFYQHPSLITEWLLLPDHLTLGEFIRNLQNMVTAFFYRSNYNPEFGLGELPLLDFLTGTMMLLGIYAYRYHLRMERTLLVGLVILLGVIVVGAAGAQLIFLLLPFTYLLAANGLAFLLEQWYTVFPRNPIARAFGTTLLSGAIIFTGYYHISRYFIAWSNAPETKQTYSQRI